MQVDQGWCDRIIPGSGEQILGKLSTQTFDVSSLTSSRNKVRTSHFCFRKVFAANVFR